MSIQGKKNKQKRDKETVKRLRSYGLKTLANLIENAHAIHKSLKKKKNAVGGILCK